VRRTCPLALDWAGEARPPDPPLQGFGLFHPAAGAAFVPRADPGVLGTHPSVRAFIETTLAEGRERGYVTTVLGRRRSSPTSTAATRWPATPPSGWR
jgi:hypothetical protein